MASVKRMTTYLPSYLVEVFFYLRLTAISSHLILIEDTVDDLARLHNKVTYFLSSLKLLDYTYVLGTAIDGRDFIFLYFIPKIILVYQLPKQRYTNIIPTVKFVY